jgi:hypothetical protein
MTIMESGKSDRGLHLFEGVPIQDQLPDDMPQGADLEIVAAPVGHRPDTICSWVIPFTGGATTASGEFFAAQCA